MATQWFSNPGQKLQTTIGALSAIIGALGLLLNVYMNWASLKAFDWSPLLFYLPWALLLIGGASLIAARLISTRARADAEAAARLAAQAEAEKAAALARAATAPAKKVGEGQRKFVIPSIDFPTPDWLEPLTPVINKKYKNETVVLDGRAFHDCEFEDVTFWWNGTKPTQVIGCEKRPREELRFSSDNPLVLGTLQIVEALKDGKADIALFDGSAR